MRLGLLAEEVGELRSILQELLHCLILGVKDAQRVGVHPSLRVLVKHVLMLLKEGDEPAAVLLSLLSGSEGVELELHMIRNAELLPDPVRKHEDLGIDIRSGEAENLDSELVELSVAPFLRLLVAEHGAHVPEPSLLVMDDAVLIAGPDASGSSFRTQGELVSSDILEGIHLLLYDVRYLAD